MIRIMLLVHSWDPANNSMMGLRRSILKTSRDYATSSFMGFCYQFIDGFAKDCLKTHVNSVHDGVKPFECIICNEKFTQRQNLKRHTESVHEKKKPYKCDLCERDFTQKLHLKKHMNRVHEGHVESMIS